MHVVTSLYTGWQYCRDVLCHYIFYVPISFVTCAIIRCCYH